MAVQALTLGGLVLAAFLLLHTTDAQCSTETRLADYGCHCNLIGQPCEINSNAYCQGPSFGNGECLCRTNYAPDGSTGRVVCRAGFYLNGPGTPGSRYGTICGSTTSPATATNYLSTSFALLLNNAVQAVTCPDVYATIEGKQIRFQINGQTGAITASTTGPLPFGFLLSGNSVPVNFVCTDARSRSSSIQIFISVLKGSTCSPSSTPCVCLTNSCCYATSTTTCQA